MIKEHPLADRILRRVEYDTVGGCWLWSGAIIANAGYGNLPIRGKSVAASRAAWMAFKGPIPDGLMVCHKCDVRLCCNPDHLFLGTQKDNMADMTAKGRGVVARGEKSGKARLTDAQVRSIKAQLHHGSTQRGLATKFGVHPATIQSIADGRSWRHIGEAA